MPKTPNVRFSFGAMHDGNRLKFVPPGQGNLDPTTRVLMFGVDGLEELATAARTEASRIRAQVEKELAEELSKDTPLKQELNRRQKELADAEQRLVEIEARPEQLQREFESALARRDADAADRAEDELATAAARVAPAKRRVEFLSEDAREAAVAVEQERESRKRAIIERWRAELSAKIDKPKADFDSAVSKAFPALYIAEHTLTALTNVSETPSPEVVPITPEQAAKFEAEQAAKFEEGVRKADEYIRDLTRSQRERDNAAWAQNPRTYI